MSFFAICIRRPVGVTLLMLSLLCTGLLAHGQLPVASLPRVDYPTIMVSAALPGADPDTMASAVAAPLERQLGRIASVAELSSSSAAGTTTIIVQFDLNRPIDDAARDVQAAINAASADLPPGMPYPPTWRKNNPSAAPVLILALTSNALPPGKVYEAADTILAQRLSQVEGVGQVTVNGAEKPAIRVRVDPAALAAMGLGSEDIRAAVAAANAAGPKGRLEGPEQSYTVQLDDQLREADAYWPIIVSNGVRLGSVATVVDDVENVRLAGWFDGEPAVLLFVFKEANANVVDTVRRIHALMPTLKAWLPASVELSVMTDRSRSIRASVQEVQQALILSIGMIAATVFIFLRRFWAAAAAAITVPLSIAGSFGAMRLLGYSLDNLSLMALAIATGFVVDDAIVVVDAISLQLARGERPLRAALSAARRIGFTVVSISVSLIAVFIPLLFMSGMIGRLFREFSVTLATAVAISGVVSLTLIPVMAAHLSRGPAISGLRGAEPVPIRAAARFYRASLRAVVRHRLFALALTCATAGLSTWLYATIPKGFFPQQDTGSIMAIAEGPTTISFQAMTERVQALNRVLLSDPAVLHAGSYTGMAGGGATNQARMFVELKPRGERDTGVDQVIARLRQLTRQVAGVTLFMVPVQELRIGGRISKSQYQFTLTGPDPAALRRWAEQLASSLQTAADIQDVTTDLEEDALQARLAIDRDTASKLGVESYDIDQALYNAFGQRFVSSIYGASYTYHVVLEADPGLQQDPSSLDKIYVSGSGHRPVPLASVVSMQRAVQPTVIAHQGQSPAVTLTFAMRPGVSLQRGTELIEQAMQVLRAPDAIRSSFQGAASVFVGSRQSQPLLVLAALVTVYVVLGVLYESMIHPLTILSTLPSAGIGALLALSATGHPLDVMGLIGILLLIGIVKKNAIMMIDYALVAQRTLGLSPEAAILEACTLRLRPILMTTFTAILGALPLALGGGEGSELRQPLGIAIVGGLMVSQVLTLFTTPVVYLALDQLRLSRVAWARLPRPREAAE